MLSLKWIRENIDTMAKTLTRRRLDLDIQVLLEWDESHRKLVGQIQTLQEEKNHLAKQIPLNKENKEAVSKLILRANEVKTLLADLEPAEASLRNKIESFIHQLPNTLSEDVPDGLDETHNACIKVVKEPLQLPFTPQTHEELGKRLGMMPADLAAQMSGARFVVLKNKLAKLERALGQFMLDLHTTKFGYEEVSPPLLVKQEAVFGVGQLPKFQEDLFQTTCGRYLISTAEVPLTNLVAHQILKEEELPKRFAALTPCFRSEAGAAGKDTKGMFRVHQFYKVELVSITYQDQGMVEHERMLTAAEEVLKQLDLPYRIMALCSGDIGFCAHKTYDIEVWLPGQNAYREISSCSYFKDYQARRLNARYRPKAHAEKKSLEFVHTLNGSGLAVGRTLIAIMENYQQFDGSIVVPDALVPYTGFRVIQGENE